MRVTLITTVRNEEDSIVKFLDSIMMQTKKPDEMVMVDGGSTDATASVISNFKFLISNKKVKLIKKKGNRSVGRNTAVKNSSYDIIACTDAGCTLDKYWLERITKPFEDKNVDVVAGFYRPETHSIFEKCLATYTCTMPDKLGLKNFLPSSRSIAFHKSSWKKVGGYPEELDTCEDLMFDKKLKKAGMKFITIPSAIVYWPQRKNILQAAVQFFNYAKGDGKARYFRPSTPLLFTRYIMGFLLFVLYYTTRNNTFLMMLLVFFLLYLFWSIGKNYNYVKNWKAYFYLPLLQIVSDVAVILGIMVGTTQR